MSMASSIWPEKHANVLGCRPLNVFLSLFRCALVSNGTQVHQLGSSAGATCDTKVREEASPYNKMQALGRRSLLRLRPGTRLFDSASSRAKWIAIRDVLRECDASSLCDADKSADVLNGLQPRHAVNRRILMVGTAKTCSVPVDARSGAPDFRVVVEALTHAGPGDVLVVAVGGNAKASWGELFSAEAKRRGLSGIVLDGACRDTRTLARLDFPVYSRSVSPMAGSCVSFSPGDLDSVVTVGGVVVNPGDVLFGDDDGVINLGRDMGRVGKAAKHAAEIKSHERRVLRDVLEKNRSLFEFMNLLDSHKAGSPPSPPPKTA
ncbi:unnamed protein product [Phaeothamnion confervicola]